MILLTSLLIFIRGNEESSIKSARVRAAYDRKRQQVWDEDRPTKPFTRQLPPWLYWDEGKQSFATLESKAKIVGEIFDWADKGWGQHAIARHLNEKKVPTFGKAQQWHRSYIVKILRNPAVVGTFVPHVREAGEGGLRRVPQQPKRGYWPAVVSNEVYERVSAQAAARAPRGRNAGREVRSIIAGLGQCASCGASMVRVSKGKFTYIVCSSAHSRAGCTYNAIRYADVEDAFLSHVDVIDEAPRGDATRQLEDEIAETDSQLSQLSDAARDLTDELILSKSDTVRDRLAEVERDFKECKAKLVQLRELRDKESSDYVLNRLAALRAELNRPEFDVAQANRALKACVSKVVVDPLTGTLDVHWLGADGSRYSTIPVHSRHVFKHE